ncbi:tetratricopeptide repeat protein [Actibacterium pelagium]|uniref:Sel1 repeat family protein n=1 Tax=Actibacterium pelagium TaxID=2029103 RepID=A0A917AM05_9RHOB|nr:tetratricopeptide repeat protein [Actibacterium pelagium]GGE57910.1 hypothetical protein GCM10011517_27140 [Actibacterium pelagium]
MRCPELILTVALVLAPLDCLAQTLASDFYRLNREELLPFAEQGIAEAQYRLARDYHVSGQDDRFAQAEKWYRLAAVQGHAGAQYDLGLMYRRGQIPPSPEGNWLGQIVRNILGKHSSNADHIAAFKWFNVAADQGHVHAQYLLGQSYEAGLGVDQDYDQAIEWYLRASEGGEDDPQYNSAANNARSALGAMYESGRGVPQDFEQAAKWYQKGFGNPDAIFNLALMYRDGRGVPRDLVLAYEFMYPFSQGASVTLMGPSKKIVWELEREMTMEQIKEALQRVEDCKDTRLYGRSPDCEFR